MEVLSGLLLINGTDVYDVFSAFLTEDSASAHSNYSELLKAPKAKPYVSVDFREDDGEKLPDALPDPAFESRDVSLYFAILTDTAASFLTKYSAFVNFLKSGWLNVSLPELDKIYKMYYLECSGYEQLTAVDGKVAAKFKVKFREPVPVF
jgi:hypothetical protein